MGLKSDIWITEKSQVPRPLIAPFVDHLVTEEAGRKVISYGLSSYGYDVRLDRQFLKFTPVRQSVVDPKRFDAECVDEFEGDVCIVPPNSFVLARTVERFHVPDNVLCLAIGKSSYARCGIVTNITPFEPGWVGIPTLEISNTSPLPAKVYAGEGIAQVLFLEGDETAVTNYRSRGGKYQGQSAVQPPML